METTTFDGMTVEAHDTDGGKLSVKVTLADGRSIRKYIVGGYWFYVVRLSVSGDKLYLTTAKRTGNRKVAERKYSAESAWSRLSPVLMLERRGGSYRVAHSTVRGVAA